VGDVLALGALLLFSVNAFVVRAASARLEQGLGFLVALVANVGFAALVVGCQLLVDGAVPRPSFSAFMLFLAAGVLSSYLGRRGYFRSVQTMGPSRATAVQVTNPVFALVFAWVLLDEHLAGRDLLAMGVVVGGLFLTSQVPRASTGDAQGRGIARIPFPVLAPALFAALCYALGNVARGSAVNQWQEPVVGGLLGAVSGTAAYLLFHVPVRELVAYVRAADRRGLVLWSFAGAITIAGQIALIGATSYIPVAIAVAISAALPILVIPASVLLFKNTEQVRPQTVLGAVLIVGGVCTLVLG
jgi:drug/metabolite transporter (DMT)-like permease